MDEMVRMSFGISSILVCNFERDEVSNYDLRGSYCTGIPLDLSHSFSFPRTVTRLLRV